MAILKSFNCLKEAFSITKMIIVELSKTIFTLATLHKPKVDVAGPIGIAQFTGQAIKFGNNAVLELIALLSLNLAVINILPFPALEFADQGTLAQRLQQFPYRPREAAELAEALTNLVGDYFGEGTPWASISDLDDGLVEHTKEMLTSIQKVRPKTVLMK